MEMDEAFAEVKGFGSHQKKIFWAVCLLQCYGAFHMVQNVYVGANPGRLCLTNDNSSSDVNVSASVDVGGTYCTQEDGVACEEIVFSTNFTSVVTQWNLVCDESYKANLVQSVFMAGMLTGAIIFGTVADKFGRLYTFYAAMVGATVFATTSSFMPTYLSYVVIRYLVGISCAGFMLVGFVLLCELIGANMRSIAGSVSAAMFGVGIMIYSGMAYLIREWRYLSLATALPGMMGILFCCLFYESPRWLLSQGRVQEAEAVFETIAVRNNTQLAKAIALDMPSIRKKGKRSNPLDLFRHPVLRWRTLTLLFAWFTCSCCYYGLTLGAGQLGSNMYISIGISGMVEVPALILANILLEKVGRRYTFGGFLIFGGACCLSILAIPNHMTIGVTVLAMLGKLAVSAAFAISFVYGTELFPTSVRNNGLGACNVTSRTGGIISPLIITLFIVFGVLGVTAGLVSLRLPETLGVPMPDTLQDLDKKDTGSEATVMPQKHGTEEKTRNVAPLQNATLEAVDGSNVKNDLDNDVIIVNTSL